MKITIVSDLITWQSVSETEEGQCEELSWSGDEEGKVFVEAERLASRSSVVCCCMYTT